MIVAFLNLQEIDVDLLLKNLTRVLVIISVAIILYYIVRLIIKRLFALSFKAKSFRNKNKVVMRKRQKTVEKILLSVWRYAVYFIVILFILGVYGINVQTLLAGAGFLGVIFAVGSQRLLQDFVDGVFNVFEDNISVGDYVEIDTVEGTIIDMSLRTVKIKSWTGELHIVPNSKIGHLINYSLQNGKAIIDIKIDYDISVKQVTDLLNSSFDSLRQSNPNIISKPIILGVNKLDSIGYDIRLSCDTIKETHWSVQRYLRAELLTLFTLNNIEVGMNQIIIKDQQPKH